MRCAQCQAELLPGKRFCHACGAPVGLACPRCGGPIKPQFGFCPDCGATLTAEAPPPAADDRFARLSRHIPQGLVEKIRSSKSSITGERKLVTVLFCDLVGSTAIAEKMDPEEYHELLEQYLELAFAEIYRVDGIVNQLAGDGMMALFGAPVAHENAPQRAVHAALAIRDALDAFNRKRAAPEERELHVRIGINTGPVVVGTVGNDFKMDYTAIGDTTNLAARFQSLAEPGMILVSEPTHRLVRGFFQARGAGPFEIKGRREPVAAYEVLGLSDAVTPMAVAEARGLTPLVGRRAELDQLRGCCERLIGNLAQVVAVIGEAGSGKSRLLYEFKQQIASEEAEVFEARCSPLSRMLAYGPWAEMLREYFELKRGEPVEVACEKIGRKLGEHHEQADEVTPYLCRLLGVPVEGLGDLSPDEIKRRTFEAISRMVFVLSQRKPVIMIIEDLQWIDESSLALLEMALTRMEDARVMLVLSYRPDYRPAWRTHAAFTQLNLRPLGETETREMIRAIAGGDPPAELEARILLKAEGNPFFTEELTRALVEEGALVSSDGRVTLTRPVEEIQIPDTVQDLIGARLDRLGAQAKRVIQVAAVIGRQFRADRLLGEEGIDVPKQLEALESIGVLHRKTLHSNEEFRFGESLTQEVAYESLLHRERRQLHDCFGALLEEASEEATPERSALIAHHYARGGDRERAVGALLRAAKDAEGVPSYRAACEAYQEAWRLAEEVLAEGEDPEGHRLRRVLETALAVARVTVLYGLMGYADAERAALRARALAEALGDARALAGSLSYLGMHLMTQNREAFSEGLALVEKGFAMVRESGEEIAAVSAARPVAWAYLLDGRFELARRTAGWILGELERKGQKKQLTDLFVAASWQSAAIDFYCGDLALAERRMSEIYDVALRAPNYTIQSASSASLAQIFFQRAEYEKVKEWAGRSLKVARDIGNLGPLWTGTLMMLAARVELGEKLALGADAALIEQGIESGGSFFMSIQLVAETLVAIGEIDRARRHVEAARERAGGRLVQALCEVAQGDVLSRLERERWDEAGAHYERALALGQALDARPVQALARLGAARLAAARGEQARAAAEAREALAICRDLDLRRYIARAEKMLAAGSRPGG
jgi:class 3 adenylate cyclase